MPDTPKNVMPFEQDAGFFARRALKKQKDGRFQEAVMLLRRALEAAPDNEEYLLNLAETYSEMGCPIESNRCLVRLMADSPEKTICWFALACNLFAMGNVQGAQNAALEYLEREPEGEYSAQAADMMTAIQEAQSLHRPGDRRLLRVYRLNERAAERLNGDRPNAAVRLLEKSLALHDTPNTRALYAYALGEADHLNDAAREANRLLRRRRLSNESRVNALRALVAAGDYDAAREAIAALDAKSLEPYELRRVLEALLTMQDGQPLQERLSQALRLSPFDRVLLHAQAALYYNEGRADDALVWWHHMLAINPTDTVAAVCVDAVSRDLPLERPIPLTLALPPALARERRDAVASAEGDELLAACRWALLEGDEAAFMAARRLSCLADGESETLLREALIEPTLSPAVKLAARDALVKRGAKGPYLIAGRDTLSPGPEDSRQIAPGRALKKCLSAAYELDDMLVPAFLAKWSAIMPRFLSLKKRGALWALSTALLARAALEQGIDEENVTEALNISRRRLEYDLRKLNRLTGDETEA